MGGEKKQQRIAGIKTVFRRHCVMPSPNVPVAGRFLNTMTFLRRNKIWPGFGQPHASMHHPTRGHIEWLGPSERSRSDGLSLVEKDVEEFVALATASNVVLFGTRRGFASAVDAETSFIVAEDFQRSRP